MEMIGALVKTLRTLLEDYDGSAADVLDRLQAENTGIEAAPIIEKLAVQIGNFDYGEALKTLDELTLRLIRPKLSD